MQSVVLSIFVFVGDCDDVFTVHSFFDFYGIFCNSFSTNVSEGKIFQYPYFWCYQLRTLCQERKDIQSDQEIINSSFFDSLF